MNAKNLISPPINIYYLSLGSNIDPEHNLPIAVSLLHENGTVSRVSSAWRSAPVETEGPEFLNCAVKYESALDQAAIKSDILRNIETQMGRVRTENKNEPRKIDIDILIANEIEIEPELWKYAHLAIPLAEIFPEYTNPISGRTIIETGNELKISTRINKDSSIQFID